jgi:hypothetical protein
MSKNTTDNGRESGTGQDTPLGVCPCPAPLPATPYRTWRDIVPSCPAVTPLLRGANAKPQPHLPASPWEAPAIRAPGERSAEAT